MLKVLEKWLYGWIIRLRETDVRLGERRRHARRFTRQMENVYSRKISSGLFAFTANWSLAVCQNTELIFGKPTNQSLVTVNRILCFFMLSNFL